MEYSYFLSRLGPKWPVPELQRRVIALRDATLDVQGAQLMRTQAPGFRASVFLAGLHLFGDDLRTAEESGASAL